ncbi:tRNA adenosine(34) deaminase TadA [Pigmentibacter sp. JX0631]|uniref:tRNA adenosine(34) deaminase TadA n=1 Tax=Pigmentibacter sp. JX0631 TaxID=2976982 RepID=UPI002469876F|nr:tRNA adenosine(34) deaminase TadA [Pigmentibacter sp. JX0631]WGL61419.1 tRNA adenosine(34) deaminase TadA [Pigmentibacter sp. JX0631]
MSIQQSNSDQKNIDSFYMLRCLELAQKAFQQQEVPVGAIVVDHSNNSIIAEAYNLRETHNNATAHAELIAISNACQNLARWRLTGCTLYVTLEPCFMCAGAIILARLPRVVFATFDPKAGAVGSLTNLLSDSRLNHTCEVTTGIFAEESSLLLKSFFKLRRNK